MKAEQLRNMKCSRKPLKTRQDLEELRGSLETLKKVKKLPRITVLHQMASQERINTSGWDAYVRKHIIPYERSRTLGEVEAERNSRRHRLYRHLRGERELYDSEYSSSASLQSRLPDQRRRGGIGDVSEEELAMAEAVWTLQWEMTQPLRHRQRAVPTKRKSRRQVQREKKSESTKSRAQSIPRRSRASSQRGERPGSAARSASTEAPSTSRQDVSVSSN
ncbi:hypothetical protein FJT64_018909 [Amphibalanus amphitrite]|uniref:Uncharacterized protein n=1 Tax=Amphibalanus amphitrite TaxID=1232801 RepID=A0A6A4WRX2_AMPAM|nr:hypothetical protein FJT64_018909 [Amphibalanus amphitrite]